MTIPAEFDEIRPYVEGEMKQAFEELINDRQFSLLLKGFVPWLPKSFRNGLLRLAFIGVKTPLDFQLRFMKPIVWYFVRKYTDGLDFEDDAIHQQPDSRYTFVSNHRDIHQHQRMPCEETHVDEITYQDKEAFFPKGL